MLRLLLSLLFGLAITFGLFVLMAKLIANNQTGPDAQEETPRIDIVMQKPSDTVQQRTRTPPPPPPPPESPPPPKVTEPTAANATASQVEIETPKMTPTMGAGIGDISGALMKDGEAAPIVRIEPRYPPIASRDGIEGWVKLSFTIDEMGGVIDIEVIESEPKRVFDREAKKALAKWKYKPKIVDGTPVKQPGLEVKLDFTLASGN